jgi:phenylalanyl-tRNA synthetase alpha chain
MKSILTQIEQLTNASIEALETSLSLEMLEAVRIEFLGRKGKIANLMPLLSDLSLEDKRVVGPLMNELKAKVEQLFEEKKQSFADMLLAQKEDSFKNFDISAYTKRPLEGSLHPYTHVHTLITDFFRSIGFQVADGPEAETEF